MSPKGNAEKSRVSKRYETKHGSRSACPIANSLDILGDKWTLLIMRDLLFLGKKYYSELACSDEHIASNLLAERLSKLVHYGLISTTQSNADARKIVYQPTEKGRDLVPVLFQLIRWGNNHIPGTNRPPKGFFEAFGQQTPQS